MRAGEWVLGGHVVVEPGVLPLPGGVADHTILWKAGGLVARILGVVEDRQVAGDTRRSRPGKDVVDMALLAAYGDVRAAELEFGGCVVIELGALPLYCVVTDGTFLGETYRQVIGILARVVTGQMTGNTGW